MSQRDADPVEHYEQIRRVKKKTHLGPTWKGEEWGGVSIWKRRLTRREPQGIPLCTWKDWKLSTFPRLQPVMCSVRASKPRQFRESQREAQWIAVELVAAKAALKCWGIWAKWAAKGGNTWKWELAGWCCYLHAGWLYMCDRGSQGVLQCGLLNCRAYRRLWDSATSLFWSEGSFYLATNGLNALRPAHRRLNCPTRHKRFKDTLKQQGLYFGTGRTPFLPHVSMRT